MELLIVGIGGFLGCIARFIVGSKILSRPQHKFPMGTFIVNISGAFILGLVASAHLPKTPGLFAAEGFLGSYTTFSTFTFEGLSLIKGKRSLLAFFYIVISVVTGILGFIAGTLLISFISK